MEKDKKKILLWHISRWFVGAVFLFSSFSKGVPAWNILQDTGVYDGLEHRQFFV